MAGAFNGLSDEEWAVFERYLPPTPAKRGRGMPHAPFRHVLNTILYVLIRGVAGQRCRKVKGGARARRAIGGCCAGSRTARWRN